MRGNQVQRAIQVHARFLVHRNPGRAGFGESGNEVVGILNHQVAVEGNTGNCFAQRRDDRRADGDVRHEMPVHDVHMQNGAAAVDRGLRLRAEPGEIGGQD